MGERISPFLGEELWMIFGDCIEISRIFPRWNLSREVSHPEAGDWIQADNTVILEGPARTLPYLMGAGKVRRGGLIALMAARAAVASLELNAF